MPTDYAGLCGLMPPRRIHDEIQYENTVEVAGAMAGFAARFTPDQAEYWNLITDFIADYDAARHPPEPPPKGWELLKMICEENGTSGAQLARILGVARSLGPMLLTGFRRITPSHAEKLAATFHMDTDAFLAR